MSQLVDRIGFASPSCIYVHTYISRCKSKNRAGVRVKVGVRAQSVRSLELRAEPYKAAALYA